MRVQFVGLGRIVSGAFPGWGLGESSTEMSPKRLSSSAEIEVYSDTAFIAISVLEKCFAKELTPAGWLPKLKEIIPSYGVSLKDDADFLRRVRADTAAVLKIENI